MSKSPLKWHGGKFYLAQWIIEQFPARARYTHYNEPYAGGLSVLFANDPTELSEAVNDLYLELSNFWSVLAHTPDRLLHQLWGTPLSQECWDNAAKDAAADDRVRRATAFFIRYRQSRQALGKDYCTPTRRLRRGMNENVSAWWSAVEGLPEAHERLRRVEIRSMDAIEFITTYDHERALFYCDPPYLHETRATTNDFVYEMTDEQHGRLLETLSNIRGMFLLSGYHSKMYDLWSQQHGYRCVERQIDNKASSKKTKDHKVECLWCNY